MKGFPKENPLKMYKYLKKLKDIMIDIYTENRGYLSNLNIEKHKNEYYIIFLSCRNLWRSDF